MIYETKEQRIKRRRKAHYKLRAIINILLSHDSWINEIDEEEELGYDVKRNIAILLAKRSEKVHATKRDKIILITNPFNRSEEDNLRLERLFNKLPCFSMFPPNVRKQLTTAVDFLCYSTDRIIYGEGDAALSMCFILTGEIAVSRLVFDKKLNKLVDETVNILKENDFFGHLALMYDEERNATCRTKTDCQLLVLYKKDFVKILKPTLEAKYENIKKALRRFEYFNNYTDAKIKECCVISKIEEYDAENIIYSQHDIQNFSYFVLCGKCMILQCLKLREKSNGKCELVVAKKKTNPLEMNNYCTTSSCRTTSIADYDDFPLKYQFIDVGSFSVGAVFGINENIENRLIVARTKVQCLLIPRNWLFKKSQNTGNVWQRLKLFLNSSIPSQEKLYDEYLKNLKWKKYKKKTIDQIREHDKISDPETQYYNIPIICRIQQQ
ncbi:hypothetical protein PVAND_001958 [Polypedilum vanderplanki]|uniref:Cyclic nucleotide-binding domain-containing protein n=1 Tax=Polypedilum vanderplanki TaxID=319348 RepID=A0A9J6BQ17_POLVA|nr:hypothetical protein PVAND_001958 [Polypedilum vanderplanki]